MRECEELLKCVQKKQGLAAGSRGWLAAASRQIEAHMPSMLEAEASRQLFTIGQKFQLARPFARGLNS